MTAKKDLDTVPANDFAEAAKSARRSLMAEFYYYLKLYRRWSVVPILLFLLLLGMFISLTGTGVTPFIYALF